jgi:hypothetical protein
MTIGSIMKKQNIGSLIQEVHEFDNSPKDKELTRRKNYLEDYLNQLDFEKVKIIQVIMYLGRDKWNDDLIERIDLIIEWQL